PCRVLGETRSIPYDGIGIPCSVPRRRVCRRRQLPELGSRRCGVGEGKQHCLTTWGFAAGRGMETARLAPHYIYHERPPRKSDYGEKIHVCDQPTAACATTNSPASPYRQLVIGARSALAPHR